MVSALFAVAVSAAASRNCVLPWRPQVPLTGTKISGVLATSISCCSGASLTTAQAASG
jgi:hypothetical protein